MNSKQSFFYQDKIFREYDIRGVYGVDFAVEFAKYFGKAFAQKLRDECPAKAEPVVAVGYDCRLSGPEVRRKLFKGLTKGGVRVVDCGMGPTPQLYHAVVTGGFEGGIQITASHNPGDQNGFKMMMLGRTLSGGDIVDLRQRVGQVIERSNCAQRIIDQQSGKQLRMVQAAGHAHGNGHQCGCSCGEETEGVELFDARAAYVDDLVSKSLPYVNAARKVKIVVDGGNGVGGLVGPEALRRIGCEVIELYTEPDGTFPNHHPDPTEIETLEELRALVISEKADFGLAWDGDADRLGVVDEQGNVIFGDMLLVILGRQLLKEVTNPIIIGDVKCSDLMFSKLREEGAETVMAKTGHSLIKAKLKELQAHLAGEMSGHIFYAHRYYGFDDAIHAALRLVEIVSHQNVHISALLKDLPRLYNTPEIRFDCPDDVKFKVVDKMLEAFKNYETITIDGVRVRFPDGWGLVRASNTQPALVMRFEASNVEALNANRSIVESKLKEILQSLV